MKTNNSIEIALDKLTKMQEGFGYVKGEINTVAILGLVGEAGEVLAETKFQKLTDIPIFKLTGQILDYCEKLDTIKKEVRNGNIDVVLQLHPNNQKLFDAELADVFYYLNALAINRGLTIADLANMAYDKVLMKQRKLPAD